MEDKEVRMSYSIDGRTLTVRRGGESLQIDTGDYPGDVMDHLAMTGLVTHLQRASVRVPKEEKMQAVETAINEVENEGVDAFAPKPRGFQSQGPRKQDRIAALAALKGASVTAVEKALAAKSKEEQKRLLEHEQVLEKARQMQATVDL